MSWELIGIWLGAFLTLSLYSFLYKDNPFYKFAEHLFVGMSAGYWVIYNIFNVLIPNWWQQMLPPDTGFNWLQVVEFAEMLVVRLRALFVILRNILDTYKPDWQALLLPEPGGFNPVWIIPGLFAAFMLMRIVPKLAGWSRLSLAMIVGTGAGMNLVGYLQSNALTQVEGTIVSLSGSSPIEVISSILLVAGVVCGLVYFFFSKAHTGVTGGVANVGITLLMVAFGASFGYTVMARISLLIGQAQFLLFDWLPTIPIFSGLGG